MLIVKLPLRLALMAAVVALCMALAPRALAAPGGGGGKPSKGGAGTISLVLLDSTDGLAHYGQHVTFNISTSATDQPYVHLVCKQNGTMVAEGWAGYFDGALGGRDFTLSSPAWTGGDADCTGYLTKPDKTVLASTSFHVYA
jgi:hypothetical protein